MTVVDFYAEAVTTGAVGVDEGGRVDGGGELLALLLALLLSSMSAPPLLFSLFSLAIWLLSLFSLLLSPDAESPEVPSALIFGGAVQRGISQTTPVKLLSVKLPFCHLRQGLPDRSSARRPALIAPWLALGPSLWAAVALAARGAVLEWSIEPSSLLQNMLVNQDSCEIAIIKLFESMQLELAMRGSDAGPSGVKSMTGNILTILPSSLDLACPLVWVAHLVLKQGLHFSLHPSS